MRTLKKCAKTNSVQLAVKANEFSDSFSPSKFSLCGYNLTIIRTSLKENRPFTLANTKKMMLLFLFLEVTKDIFYSPI